MDFATFQRLVAEARAEGTGRLVIPVYKRLSADLLTPVSAFLALREPGAYGFLLESVEGGEKLARYSFLGKNPYRIVRAFGERVEVEEQGEHATRTRRDLPRYSGARAGCPRCLRTAGGKTSLACCSG